MMKKTLPLTLVLLGTALLITAVVFWIDSSSSVEPENFGKSLRDWITLVVGLGVSLKGWIDLFKKEQPSTPSQSNSNGGVIISGEVKTVSGLVGRDQNITNIASEDSAYNVEGLQNPYLGLSAFTFEDRDKYAGREQLTREVLKRLLDSNDQSNLLFITGASGSGKSSFAQAGVLPAIVSYYAKKDYKVHYNIFRPSRNPKKRLDEAIHRVGSQEIQVIIIDQFEELFTQSLPDEREYLIKYISNLPFDSRRIFIATLRSDYLGEIFDVSVLWEKAKQGISLRSMKLQELKDAIQRPLQARYPDGNKRFENKLVDKLAEDTLESVSYLPLLQVTLEDLWNKGQLRLSAYNSLTDAIKERADTVLKFRDFDGASPFDLRPQEEQDETMGIMLNLVNVSIDDNIKRDARINRSIDNFNSKQKALIKELSRARLVSIDIEDGKEIVSLIHETLIRNWSLLSENIKNKRIQMQKRSRFEMQFRLWISTSRQERYLMSEGQLAEAIELTQENDISVHGNDAKEFIQASNRKLELERIRSKTASVLTILQNPSLSLEIDDIIEIILQNVAEIINSEGANLFLEKEQDGKLEHLGTWGLSRLPLENYHFYVKRSMKHLESQVFNEDNIIILPMKFDDHALAAIQLDGNKNHQIVAAEELSLLSLFVSEIAKVLAPRWLEAMILKMIYLRMDNIDNIQNKIQLALESVGTQAQADAGLLCTYRDGGFILRASFGYDKSVEEKLIEMIDDKEIKTIMLGDDLSKQHCWINFIPKNNVLPGAKSSLIVPVKQDVVSIGLLFFETKGTFDGDQYLLRHISEHVAEKVQSYMQIFDNFQRMGDRLKSAEIFGKMAFTASASVHALKNHMGVIKGNLQLLKLGFDEETKDTADTARKHMIEEKKNMADMAFKRANDVIALVNSLHEPGKIQNDTGVDVNSCINRAAERALGVDVPWVKKKLALDCPLVKTMPEMLVEAFKVLIRNANESMSDTIEGHRSLEIESRLVDGDIEVTIQDNGYGIAPENMSKIFEMRYTTKESGLGFGLYWAKDYIEGLGGAISVESELGKGTKFTIKLPSLTTKQSLGDNSKPQGSTQVYVPNIQIKDGNQIRTSPSPLKTKTSNLAKPLPSQAANDLNVATPAQARSFVQEIAPAVNDKDADVIAQQCSYIPLAIKMATNVLLLRSDWEPSELIKQFHEYSAGSSPIESALKLVYENLDKATRKRFRQFYLAKSIVKKEKLEKEDIFAVWRWGNSNLGLLLCLPYSLLVRLVYVGVMIGTAVPITLIIFSLGSNLVKKILFRLAVILSVPISIVLLIPFLIVYIFDWILKRLYEFVWHRPPWKYDSNAEFFLYRLLQTGLIQADFSSYTMHESTFEFAKKVSKQNFWDYCLKTILVSEIDPSDKEIAPIFFYTRLLDYTTDIFKDILKDIFSNK